MSHIETVAKIAILPGIGGRTRRFALEATQQWIASCRGMGDTANLQLAFATAQAVHQDVASQRPLSVVDADLARAYQASQAGFESWEFDQAYAAYANAQRDRDNYASMIERGYKPATTQYDVTTSVDQSRSIDTGSGNEIWDTTTGTASDVLFFSSPLAWYMAGAPRGAVVEGVGKVAGRIGEVIKMAGKAIERGACAAIPGAKWNEATRSCDLPDPGAWIDRLKKILIAAALGLIAVGAGYVALSNYARGRGQRTNPPGRGRRSPHPPRTYHRPRPGSYHVAGRRSA